jgi:uncharacterized protein (TIGR02246 family)
MKNFVVMIIALLGTTFSLNAQNTGEQAAWSTMEAAKEAYSKLDLEAFGKAFAEDAVMVSPMGDWLIGKEAIKQVHSQLFDAASKMEPQSPEEIQAGMQDEKIRLLTDEVAQYTCNSVESAGDKEQKMAFSALICKQPNGEWLIASVQMTPFVSYANRQQ